MDCDGKIYKIPNEMYKLLKMRDWNSISIQRIKSKDNMMANDHVMILLKHYKNVPKDLKR